MICAAQWRSPHHLCVPHSRAPSARPQRERTHAHESRVARDATCECSLSRTRSPPTPHPRLPRPRQLSPAGLSLIAFRDALDAARAALQTAWDARARTLRERESSLFQLYSDIGAGIEAAFAAIGDRVSAARVGAYDAEIARVRAV